MTTAAPSLLDLFRLDGKVAVVTGSGRGIGACALHLASEAGSWVTGQTLTVAGGL